MSYGFGNRTVIDGLVFYLDASNPASYNSIADDKKWRSIAKDISIGYFSPTSTPSFSNNLYGKKAINFAGSSKAIIGTIGVDNLLDINTTGTITVQIVFATEGPEGEVWIFASGNNSSEVLPQYAVGITYTGVQTANIYHGGTTTRVTVGGVEYRRYDVLTVSFGTSTKVYYNQTDLGSHNTIPINPISPGNLWQMAYNPTRSTNFQGGVNAVRVYNRELTAVEVSQNYQFYTQKP